MMKNSERKRDTIERYRLLCNVVESYKKGDAKCISITSNSDTEGKTIIAKNLAMLLSEQGKKTLFIDCNLNSNSKVKKIQTSKKTGLIAILELINKEKEESVKGTSINDEQLMNYVIESKCENLSTLSLGANDLEKYSFLFNTEYLKTAMERLKKYYDYLIVDAPSFINLSYTQIVSAASDGCLFVIKEGVNEINAGDEIKEKIATLGCKVLGCIFNKGNDRNKMFGDRNKGFINVEYKGRRDRTKINQKVSEGL